MLAEVRRRAGAAGRPFRVMLEEVIACGLGTSGKSKSRRRVRIQPRALGLKAVYQKMSLNQLYDQLEAEGMATKPARRK